MVFNDETRENMFTPTPTSIQELWEHVCSVYPNFSEHGCMAIYEGKPQRIDAMLKSRDY